MILLSCIAVSLGTSFAPWMASFTETVERRNPALIATGLAMWGLIIRIVIAVSVFFVPKVVTTVTTLVEKGPVVQAVLADPTPVGKTTIGQVDDRGVGEPRRGREAQGDRDRDARRATPADRQFLTTTAPKALGPAEPRGAEQGRRRLTSVAKALGHASPRGRRRQGSTPSPRPAKDSPEQWQTYFFVGVGGEVVFIPLILLMAGYWDPRKAKRAEEEHEARIAAEMEKLRRDQPGSEAPVSVNAGAV